MCDQGCLSNSNSIVFPAEINLFNAESNHPLRLHCVVVCVCVCVCVYENVCTWANLFVCVCETKTTCAVEGASEFGARVRSVIWRLICHSADSGLRPSHLAGPTRFSPPSLSISPSLPLSLPLSLCLSLFLLPAHKVYPRVHLQASTVDTHTSLRVANTHVFQRLALSCSEEKKKSP